MIWVIEDARSKRPIYWSGMIAGNTPTERIPIFSSNWEVAVCFAGKADAERVAEHFSVECRIVAHDWE